jgi:hypothetical protein
MLVLNDQNEGIWVDHTYRGASIRLQIRPRDADVVASINKKHTKFEYRINPQTKQSEKVPVYDATSAAEDILDYLLQGFEGVELGPGKPLEVSKKSKIRLAFLPPDQGEELLFDFITSKAKEFEVITATEEAGEEKN